MIAPWSRELSQNTAKCAIIDLGQAVSNWREYGRKRKQGIGGGRVGFPRFKRRKHEEGFRADNGPDTVGVDGKGATLPKIGPLAMVEHLRFRDRICEVTVNRTAGQWFASFSIDTGEPPFGLGRTHHRGRRRHHKTGRLLVGSRGGESQGTGTSPETTEEAG